jgi:hypothetical protein
MAYSLPLLEGAIVQETSWITTAQSLTQAAAIYGSWHIRKPLTVQEFSFHISTAVNNLTSSVIALEYVNNNQGATPGTTSICTLTIPNGATAGTTYYNNGFTPQRVMPGSLLQVRLKTQGGLGGTPTGAGYSGFFASYSPEDNTNVTPANSMILLTS